MDYDWLFNENCDQTEADTQNDSHDNLYYSWLLEDEQDKRIEEYDYSWIFQDNTETQTNEDENLVHSASISSATLSNVENSGRIKITNPHGRVGKHKFYPQIIHLVKSYIESHGYAAHTKRHTETGSCGVTAPQIQSYLESQIEGLKISLSTCRRLLMPPRKSTNSAKYYKGLVEARRPAKSNQQPSKVHKDLHFTRTQVNYVNELMYYYGGETLQYSVDNKNKVNVGTLAVSRYHHIGSFFPILDKPDYPDHDFPLENFKIVPSGKLIQAYYFSDFILPVYLLIMESFPSKKLSLFSQFCVFWGFFPKFSDFFPQK